MRYGNGMAALAGAALVLAAPMALAQTKTTNQGISDAAITIGTHQDLSGPVKGWGVPVANGMKMAVEAINAAGGINGRKIKLIIEDSLPATDEMLTMRPYPQAFITCPTYRLQ